MSLPNGRILVVGGRGPSNGLASSELFDPSVTGTPAGPRAPGGSGRWKLGATKPTSTDFSSAAAQLLPDGRVVVVPKYGLADFHVYDPKLDTWTTVFSHQAPQCNACAQGYTGPYPAFFLAAPMANAKVLLLTVDPQKAIATKAEIIDLVRSEVEGVELEERDLSFDGDMRDVAVSCQKIYERLGFSASIPVIDGIREVRDAILSGLISEPASPRYRNYELALR